jgi:crossover junction endodeoxyribonuclease RuvC
LRILGIDCGSAATGWGLVEINEQGRRVVEAGTIRTNAAQPMEARLLHIGMSLREIVARTRPDTAAMEEVFHSVNAQSALKLAQVRGVALFVLAEAGLDVGAYTPLAVKSSVVGYGKAEKGQVQWMLPSLLAMDGPLDSPDAADAIAVAYCHSVHVRAEVKR